jgi:hypothetical protein
MIIIIIIIIIIKIPYIILKKSCGLLTDIALHICNKYKASFVITPCCYGQIANPPPENTQILDSYLQKALRSKLFNLEASGNLCVLVI